MNSIARRATVLATVAALAVLPACSSTSTSTGTSGGTSGKKLKVVTAFYPFQFAAQQVAGDKADVTSLTPAGSEPHDLEPTPQQIASLGEADLVIYQKGFQSKVDDAVAQAQPKNVIDVSTLVQMMPATGTDEEGKPATGNDPHEWLLPTNMQAITKAVDEKLKSLDSADASTFDANATKLDAQLGDLDKSFTDGLKSCQRTTFITSHAAFGYLAKKYGLTQVGINGLSPDAEPSPARVAEVQQLAKAKGVTTIFYETLVSPSQSKAIAGDMGLKTDVLDPLEGISKESRGSDYIAVQKANLAALKTANGCK